MHSLVKLCPSNFEVGVLVLASIRFILWEAIFEAVCMDQNIYFDGGTVVVVNFVHDEHALLLAALEE